MKKILCFTAVFALALILAPAVQAQTNWNPDAQANDTSASDGFSASTEAIAVNFAGNWTAANQTVESLDFLDFGKTKANRVYLEGHQLIPASSIGISIYAGGPGLQLNLAHWLAKTNVKATNLTMEMFGAVGNGIPQTGDSHMAVLAGGLFKYRINSALTWDAGRFEYIHWGSQNGFGISSGLKYIFAK